MPMPVAQDLDEVEDNNLQLGIDGAPLETVFSADPAESMVEIVREHSANAERWRHRGMALRRAAGGIKPAQQQLHRVKGCRQLPQLAAALEAIPTDESGPLEPQTAQISTVVDKSR